MAADQNDDDTQDGEYVDIDMPEIGGDVVDTPDGGAIVTMEAPKDKTPSDDFMVNLAEELPEQDLGRLAVQFTELIEKDKEARKLRDKQYEEGIRRTGLGNDAPGGASFDGASRVVHPMMTKACVDFAARAIKELFPPDGPVKTKVWGEATKQRWKKGERKSALMNWQLTTQAKEFRGELEQLLTQLPLGGAQYLKVTWNRDRNRPNFVFIPIDDIYLPYSATNFYTADRRTEVQYLTDVQMQARIKSGMYRDVDLMPAGMEPDPSKTQRANDKIEGRESSGYNEDGLRTVYEITGVIDIEDDVGPAPYILTVDDATDKVLGLYRNWDEDDDTLEELTWIVEWPFIPWRGAYPIGIPHMIGGLSAAATGALRALLDAAHISNSQTMMKLKGGSAGGQTQSIQPTEMLEVEGGLGSDDIRKIIMPLPFNQPSAVLMQLLTFLVGEADSVIRTTLDEAPEQSANTPVGTQLARVEQAMVVFSAIHQRLHAAFGRLLDVLGRLNGMYLDDKMLKAEVGDDLASKADFEGPLDVVPVSDPNIFSEAQRFAQIQAVAQRSALLPMLYDQRKVEERILETLKIPDAASLLAPAQTPSEENAVKENVKAALGQPVIAMPDQDHVAHLKTHLGFTLSPTLGMSPLIAPALLPIMINHLKEHIVLWYAAQTFEQAKGVSDEDVDISELMDNTKDKADKQALDRMIAEASLNAVQQAEEAFSQLPPVIAQMQQMAQQFAPQPPMDPAAMVAMKDIEMRKGLGEGKLALDKEKMGTATQTAAQKLQADAAKTQGQMSQQAQSGMSQLQLRAHEIEQRSKDAAEARRVEMMRVAVEQQGQEERAAAQIASQLQMNREDNHVAIELARVNANSRMTTDPNPGD